MKKLFFSLSVIFVFLVFPQSGIAYAQENPFVDISGSEYYEEIEYYHSMGAVNGYGDGTFQPDKTCSFNEGLSILANIYGDSNAEEYKEFLRNKGLLPSYTPSKFYSRDMNGIDQMTVAIVALYNNLNENSDMEVVPYKTWMYTNDGKKYFTSSTYNDWATLVSELSILTSNRKATRAEVLGIIYKVSHGEYKIPVPAIVENTIVKEDSVSISSVNDILYLYMKYIPEGHRSLFKRNRWRLSILHSTSIKTVYNPENTGLPDEIAKDLTVAGICSFLKKRIYLRDDVASPRVIVHEMGHFLSSYAWRNGQRIWSLQEYTALYEEEKDALSTLTKSEYCTYSEDEYFAESYRVYILEPIRFEQSCPKTYAFLNEICSSAFTGPEDLEFQSNREVSSSLIKIISPTSIPYFYASSFVFNSRASREEVNHLFSNNLDLTRGEVAGLYLFFTDIYDRTLKFYPQWMYEGMDAYEEQTYLQEFCDFIISSGWIESSDEIILTEDEISDIIDTVNSRIPKYRPERPALFDEYNIVYDSKDFHDCNRQVGYMAKYLPESVLTLWKEKRWDIFLTDNVAKYNRLKEETPAGLTLWGWKDSNRIVVGSSFLEDTILHEFGHFCEHLLLSEKELSSAYMEELAVSSVASRSEYSRTDKYECFAEAFVAYLINEDGARAYLDKNAPTMVFLVLKVCPELAKTGN